MEPAAPDQLRPLYQRATILTLAEIKPGNLYRNVNTTVVFGTDRMRLRNYQYASVSSRGERRSGAFWRNIAVVDASAADAFIQQAQIGRAVFPNSTVEILFDLGINYDGFIPSGDFAEAGYDKMPGGGSAWRRRFLPQERSVNGVALDEAHLADVVAELPQFLEIDFGPLNLEHALDRICVLDLLYPTQVRSNFRGDSTGIRYSIADPLGWIAKLGEPKLSVEFYQLGLLMGARSFAPLLEETLQMSPAHSVRYWLTAGGVVLDAAGYTFIRSIQMQMNIAEPDVVIPIGNSTTTIPVTARNSSPVQVGNAQPLPDVFSPRRLAATWREQMMRAMQHVERIFNGGSAARSRADGFQWLSEMIRAEVANKSGAIIIRAVDPFGVDMEAIKALIPLAAGAPNAEIRLLSDNKPPPPGSLRDYVGRIVRKILGKIRRTTPQSILDDSFTRGAAALARQFGVTIRWYKPTVSLHDRFLEVGARIWHIGHSFNRLGCDLSAIVEFRDLQERANLRAILDEQFVDANLERTFS